MRDLRDALLNRLYNFHSLISKYRRASFTVLILLIIPVTLFALQFTQIFHSHAATIPGSYGYGGFNQDVYGTSTLIISPTPTLTITPITTPSLAPPTPIPSPTKEVTQIPTPTNSPSAPTPTFSPGTTVLSMNVLLHGIGGSGDNVNPDSSSSNKNPKHTSRQITVWLYKDKEELSASSSASFVYDQVSGSYKGTVALNNLLLTGNYIIKVKESTHLRKIIPGIQVITKGQNNILPEVALTAGDMNGDNSLSIVDYSMISDCFGNTIQPGSCPSEKKNLTDLNDDGEVNLFDYNILLREFANQIGE